MNTASSSSLRASSGRRVLVVDDSRAMRELIGVTLRSAGFQVGVASCGQDALVRLADERFDLVMVDINMPLMDGFALTRALRALPAYRDVPVVVLTSEASVERRQEGTRAGATDWLIKPFRPEQLLSRVSHFLRSTPESAA